MLGFAPSMRLELESMVLIYQVSKSNEITELYDQYYRYNIIITMVIKLVNSMTTREVVECEEVVLVLKVLYPMCPKYCLELLEKIKKRSDL